MCRQDVGLDSWLLAIGTDQRRELEGILGPVLRDLLLVELRGDVGIGRPRPPVVVLVLVGQDVGLYSRRPPRRRRDTDRDGCRRFGRSRWSGWPGGGSKSEVVVVDVIVTR